MGHQRKGRTTTTHKSHTLPSSPTHSFSSSSSSDFEFTISLSPRKSSTCNLCPADELFYKGQLLPLHLSPRISMVRTLLLSSSSTSSSSSSTNNSRHSSDSHSSFSTDGGCDSSRPSSVAEDEDILTKRLNHTTATTKLFTSSSSSSSAATVAPARTNLFNQTNNKKSPSTSKYFSLSRFSSVFRKECVKPKRTVDPEINIISGSTVKRMSVTAKEVIRRYLKKVKPLYEKLSHHQKQGQGQKGMAAKTDAGRKDKDVISHSFSGNLRYPKRKMGCVSSCPSSMRSSPSHSGILCRNAVIRGTTTPPAARSYADSASMEELQSAIQGAIAHCKNSMVESNTKAFDVRSYFLDLNLQQLVIN